MKIKTLFPLMLVMLLTTMASAHPVVLVSYSKSCVLCGSVNEDKHLVTYEAPDGTTTTYWARSVSCCGFGLNFCPKASAFINDRELEEWTGRPTRDLLAWAEDNIEAGITTGSHSIQVYNTTYKQLYLFNVTWAVGEDGTEQIEVIFDTI